MVRARPMLALSATLALAGLAGAQEPKVGNDWYADRVEYGFKVKMPKGWDLIPPQPDEPNILVNCSSPSNDFIEISKKTFLPIHCYLLRFDNRPERDLKREFQLNGQTVEFTLEPAKNIKSWLQDYYGLGSSWRCDSKKYPKTLDIKGVQAQYWLYEANGRDDPSVVIHAFVAEYALAPDVKICLLGNGPSDKRWRSYEGAWTQLAKSFTPLELKQVVPSRDSALASPRAKKRTELELEVAKYPGWKLLETENYFVLSEVDDESFMKELLERLEAIRKVYEEHYPAEKARATAAGAGTSEEADEIASGLDPLEASRLSVVRVCKSLESFKKYGGVGLGYFDRVNQQLVLCDEKAVLGRADTWDTLNHEAFHQYMFYFYGTLSPHSWYDEGSGDFYGAWEYRRKRFYPKESNLRIRDVQDLIRTERYIPLQEFVTWSKAEYYGDNDRKLEGSDCYAQGWSLIHFLRTAGKDRAEGWNSAWDKILDIYLETLAATGDLDEAVDKAFEGVDWKAFEECWKAYIESI